MIMKHSATISIAFLLMGCPADDQPNAEATGLVTGPVSTSGPDVPGSSEGPIESDTAGDGDGDPTTGDGDGQGDGDGMSGDGDGVPGDGDGDGDGDPQVEPRSLVVESNGMRIGYLMSVWDYVFYVWDDVNEVTFSVNQQTGHVTAPGGGFYYTTPDCTGTPYAPQSYVSTAECGSIGAPERTHLRCIGCSTGGHSAAMTLFVPQGPPQMIAAQSSNSNGCNPAPIALCAYPMQPTNVIPKTFNLPIVVTESP